MHGLLIAEKPSVKRAVEAVYKKEAGKLPYSGLCGLSWTPDAVARTGGLQPCLVRLE